MYENRQERPQSQFNLYQISKVFTKYKLEDLNIPMIIIIFLFKIIIFLIYFLLNNYPITDFIIVLVFTSIDFWCTKNLNGRLMVGYKWDFYINPQTQKQQWIFTSKNSQKAHIINKYVFWGNFVFLILFWLIIWIIDLIINPLIWKILDTFCLFMTLLNCYSFYRCFDKSGETSRFTSLAQRMGLPSEKRMNQQQADF